ncbi:MAG TPA: glucose 1-dehydrogenase [Anaerolineae bacterium]|nr:glucose 1-dehydrogenase [Anaerolineae bacterium]
MIDKVAIVTGGSSGIGRATAVSFAQEGARVAIFDRDVAGGQQTVEEIQASGGTAIFVQTDVSVAQDVEAAMKRTVEGFDRLDVIFNGAGLSGRKWGDGPAADCTEEAWDRVLAINLKSVFLCCKYAIREMLKNGGGAIVNLSSVLGLVGGDEDFATHAYAASKGGIISLTRSIAAYYAPHKIRANVICPGLIATPMSQRAQSNAAIRARLSDLQPLTGDFGQPIDVAQAALYLASDQSKFVTGTVLTVDGGWTVK